MKKLVYLVVFDGFSDLDAAKAMTRIPRNEEVKFSLISHSLDPVKSRGGVRVLPDIDFLPDCDLDDIDADSTLMVILPGGDSWQERKNTFIEPLVLHCLQNRIPVLALSEAAACLSEFERDSFQHGYFAEVNIASRKVKELFA